MKKAKVRDGRIQHVWPFVKTLPDGTKVIKECPYLNRKGKPLPDCIVDVPDEAKPGLLWDGEKLSVAVKAPASPPPHDIVLDIIAEKLGMTWEELKAEAKKRKDAVGTS